MQFNNPKLSIRINTRLNYLGYPMLCMDKWNFSSWKIKDGIISYKGKTHGNFTMDELNFLLAWLSMFDKNMNGHICITDKESKKDFVYINRKIELSSHELLKDIDLINRPKFKIATMNSVSDIHSSITTYILMKKIMQHWSH